MWENIKLTYIALRVKQDLFTSLVITTFVCFNMVLEHFQSFSVATKTCIEVNLSRLLSYFVRFSFLLYYRLLNLSAIDCQIAIAKQIVSRSAWVAVGKFIYWMDFVSKVSEIEYRDKFSSPLPPPPIIIILNYF